MNISFANDPIALRRLIAYEALGKVPVFQAYKNMCTRIGDNVMTYPDYEFWYWRFIQGEMNLNYERRDTPKKLLELPLEILLSIFEKFTPLERLIMRKVSRVVRTCIDSIDPKISRIDFESKRERGETTIDYKTFDVRYQGNTDCLVTYVWMQPSKSTLIRNTNHSELALNDLSIVLSNPKLNLKSLGITSDAEKLKVLQTYLQSLSHKIRVDKVKIRTEDSIEETMILPFLEPGNLEEITICFKDYCKRTKHFYLEVSRERLKQLTEMIQCREAKMLTIWCFFNDNFPIEYFLNCHGLKLCNFNWNSPISVDTAFRFLEVLLTSKILKSFEMEFNNCKNLREQIRNRLLYAVETKIDSGIFKISIENSYRVFKLDLNRCRIQLTRQ